MHSAYRDVYDGCQEDPEGYWAAAATEIDWYKPWDKVFDPYAGQYGLWFPGAECNTCYNCIDRHVEAGRADQAALIYDSPVTNTQKTYTYRELKDEVQAFAAVLRDR
ncbi:MAG: acetyl-coenzyme A synthetase N-terminal domain-containing protein, partial [Methyloligellaceae bacterium]